MVGVNREVCQQVKVQKVVPPFTQNTLVFLKMLKIVEDSPIKKIHP